MDQETAKRLFFDGAIFIFLDVPEGTEFGIDMKSWNTGENFRGVKMIPQGVHYIFYSGVNETGDTAPRTGFFHYFHKSELLAKKWDNELEDLSKVEVEERDVVSFKANITALDKFLGPYPYDISKRWHSLTSHITENLIRKLMPACGTVKSALELEPCGDLERPRGGNIIDDAASTSKVKRSRFSDCDDLLDNLLPEMKPKPGTEIKFTSIPDKKYPDGATPAEVTQHCLDSSYVLDVMLEQYVYEMDFIGEIEFAYVCFLVGHSLEAFERWKKIVGLMCSCEIAIKKHRNLYDVFISLLQVQVKEIPGEFLADIVSNNNFVYIKLRNLFRATKSSDVDGRLKTKMERFQKSLTDSFGWDFTHLDSEDEDDAPIVVET